MQTYILKRLLLVFPTLFIITALSYGMMRLAPGDPVKGGNMLSAGGGMEDGGTGVQQEGEGASESSKMFKEFFDLDKPIPVGYLYWLVGNPNKEKRKGVLRGDLGVSVTVSMGTPVWDLLRERLPVTITLNILAVLVVYTIAIPAGLASAIYRGSVLDRSTSLIFFLLYSLPSFWVGLLLILVASKWIPTWPTLGLESWESYIFPVVCLSYGSFAFLSRFARVGMLEIVQQDFIRTARAKGLSEWRVILKHALRNSLIPLVTIFAGLLPGLIGGSIIIEYIFNINGMGDLAIKALGARDYPIIMTIFGFSALLTLIGILISDLLYVVVDPRISYD